MSFKEYIVHHRVYCEACIAPMPAIDVAKINGKDHALCFKHFHQLKPTNRVKASTTPRG